jgi:transposase
VPAAGEDQKFPAFGAVDYATGQVLWQMSARTGATAFIAFREHLAEALPATEPVVLVLDTVGSHKSHALRAVWRRYASRFEPFFLLAYAPHLTLIELLWRSVKQRLACHRWWNDRVRLIQATETVVAHLEVRFYVIDGSTFRPTHTVCQSA